MVKNGKYGRKYRIGSATLCHQHFYQYWHGLFQEVHHYKFKVNQIPNWVDFFNKHTDTVYAHASTKTNHIHPAHSLA